MFFFHGSLVLSSMLNAPYITKTSNEQKTLDTI